ILVLLIASTPCQRREWSVSSGLAEDVAAPLRSGGVMSDDWPHGWHSDEPGRPGAGGQRPQPGFTPNSPGPRGQRPPNPAGQGWHAPGDRAAWPAQPPSRSWTGGGGGAGGGPGGGGYRPRG